LFSNLNRFNEEASAQNKSQNSSSSSPSSVSSSCSISSASTDLKKSKQLLSASQSNHGEELEEKNDIDRSNSKEDFENDQEDDEENLKSGFEGSDESNYGLMVDDFTDEDDGDERQLEIDLRDNKQRKQEAIRMNKHESCKKRKISKMELTSYYSMIRKQYGQNNTGLSTDETSGSVKDMSVKRLKSNESNSACSGVGADDLVDFRSYLTRTISEILTSQLTLARKVDKIKVNFNQISKKLKSEFSFFFSYLEIYFAKFYFRQIFLSRKI
jgi:hypothetical protein